MAAMTYASLSALIQKYANRTDAYFTSSIPDFIQMAQYRIYQEAKDIGELQVAIGVFIANNSQIIKPPSWGRTISLYYGSITNRATDLVVMEASSYEFCLNYWPIGTVATAAPRYYSDEGITGESYARIYIAPTPNLAYQYTMKYIAAYPVPALGEGETQQNWLTQRYPNLLLYACLVEAIPFMKDDERIPVWQSMYDRILQVVNNQTKERHTDRSSVRDAL